jgi:DNA-binding CsgD family transcriptional regulator
MALGSTLATSTLTARQRVDVRTNARRRRARAQERAARMASHEMTPAETLCVELLIGGKTIGEIATYRKVSVAAIYQNVRYAMKRTGTRTREQLVAWWAVRRMAAQQEEIAA